jgi:hypothetical protein
MVPSTEIGISPYKFKQEGGFSYPPVIETILDQKNSKSSDQVSGVEVASGSAVSVDTIEVAAFVVAVGVGGAS